MMTESTDTPTRQRIRNALWGAFIGDALAMPVHWFYSPQRIREQFPEGIGGYEAPPHPHPDAFMLGMAYQPDVERAKALGRPFDILHGHARFYRTPFSKFEFELSEREGEHGNRTAADSERIHYHHGLQAGESTLGAMLLRVLMRSVIHRGGYSQQGFLDDFVSFMTTPGMHRDPYTETYIRRWFENYSRGEAPENCAGHQRHNWSIGSLGGVIRPLALALLNTDNPMLAQGMALGHQQLTHRSELVSGALATLVPALIGLIHGQSARLVFSQLSRTLLVPAVSGSELFRHYREHNGPDNIPDDTMWRLHMDFASVTAAEIAFGYLGSPCYIEHGLPLLVRTALQCGLQFRPAVQANAEEGGDNVHRGMVLGLLLGATSHTLPQDLVAGLSDSRAIGEEIDAFTEIAITGHGHLNL